MRQIGSGRGCSQCSRISIARVCIAKPWIPAVYLKSAEGAILAFLRFNEMSNLRDAKAVELFDSH